jgi:hypothetical protein
MGPRPSLRVEFSGRQSVNPIASLQAISPRLERPGRKAGL